MLKFGVHERKSEDVGGARIEGQNNGGLGKKEQGGGFRSKEKSYVTEEECVRR